MSGLVFSGHQPNFFPYMGFFYKMMKSDIFVLDDDVQYSRGKDVKHNANVIKANGKRQQITVPVNYHLGDKINTVKIYNEKPWRRKILKSLEVNYRNTPYFQEVYNMISKHINGDYDKLSDLNIAAIKEVASRFGIKCRIIIASKDIPTDLTNNARNVYQCSKLGCGIYYSGIGGKAYNDISMYADNNIKVVYTDYKPPIYKQTKGVFLENLSVIDYLFNAGFKLPTDWRKDG